LPAPSHLAKSTCTSAPMPAKVIRLRAAAAALPVRRTAIHRAQPAHLRPGDPVLPRRLLRRSPIRLPLLYDGLFAGQLLERLKPVAPGKPALLHYCMWLSVMIYLAFTPTSFSSSTSISISGASAAQPQPRSRSRSQPAAQPPPPLRGKAEKKSQRVKESSIPDTTDREAVTCAGVVSVDSRVVRDQVAFPGECSTRGG
jgi:hypothetical protein